MLRFGVLGAAGIVQTALINPVRRRPDVSVVAVAARDKNRAAAFARQHQIDNSCGTYESLIADSDIDVVYVALPPAMHAQWSIAALMAGKHVLCEKPAATTAVDAGEMVAAANAAGRRLIEAFHDRYYPLAKTLLRLLERGMVGQIRGCEATLVAPMPFDPTSIRHDPKLGGGALMDLGCYPVHWLRTLTGEEPEVGSASARLNPLGGDMEASAMLQFPSGIWWRLVTSMDVKAFQATLTIDGSGGNIVITNPLHPHAGHSFLLDANGSPPRTFTVGGRDQP
jgi:predicted dehydrogenase